LTQRRDRFVCYAVAPDLHESIAEFLTRLFGIVVRLKIHPALRIDAKKCAETNGSVGGDGAFPLNDFTDATCRYFDCFCERVLSDAHWGEPFFREDIAGSVRIATRSKFTNRATRPSSASPVLYRIPTLGNNPSQFPR